MRESWWHVRIASRVVFWAVAGAAACGQPDSVTAPRAIELAGTPSPPDIAGSWSWSETAKGLIPEEFAGPVFGIQPEGRATHFTCQNGGTFTIFQDGTSFTGIGTQTGTCTTRGGQIIDNTFAEPFPLVDGRVSGRSIYFGFGDPICPYSGVLTVEGGIATEMDGTGRCGPFGPRDHYKTVNWQASRLPD